MPDAPWSVGSATGVGSLPGTDIGEAVKLVFGELALPHLPELPARGPGADMIGRGAGLLAELPVELYAGRWRVAARPGRDLRRTLDLLERDLDAITEAGDGYVGPIKVQAPGPWTLAAGIDLPVGGPILRDHGAAADLVASLAEGVRSHIGDVARRVPGATVLLQLDEPMLPAVLAGRVPTESGLRTLRSILPSTVEAALRSIVAAAGVPVVMHCCAPDAPVGLFVAAGATAVSLDLALVGTAGELDAIGEALDGGVALFAGAVPTSPPRPPTSKALPPKPPTPKPPPSKPPLKPSEPPEARGQAAPDPDAGRPPTSAEVARRIETLWRRLGFAMSRLPEQVVVTPACGLAGATPDYARASLGVCVEAGRRLAEHRS